MSELEALRNRYLEVFSNGDKFLSEYLLKASSVVHDIAIGKGPLLNSRPYEIERAGFKIAKRLAKLPENKKNVHIYHLDDLGRIIYVDIHGQSAEVVNREFFNYEKSRVERLYFASTGKLRNISWSFFSEGRFDAELNWGEYGCSISKYIYSDEGVLEKIQVHQKEHIDTSFSDFNVLLEYDGCGLSRITNVFPGGYEEQRYP